MTERVNMIGPWLKKRLGGRTVKIGLDTGLGCPNSGCLYCSPQAASQNRSGLDLTRQLQRGMSRLAGKNALAYFQAHTSTNAPAAQLEPVFYQAANWPGVRGIIISTRPDCLDPQHWQLLARLKRQGHLCWLELGLQSAHERTLRLIRRGHDLACFVDAIQQAHSLNIEVVAHVILGLPDETPADTEVTARLLASLGVWGVKMHSLMVLEDTPLARLWRDGVFIPWSLETWVQASARFISLLPPLTTIHRLSADPGPGETCLAPSWIQPKARALAALASYLERHNIYQGCAYQPFIKS